jgi:hypothetical protein
MARLAIVLHEVTRGPSEVRLGRVLEFFGVPFEELDVAAVAEKRGVGSECAIFGSLRAICSVQKRVEAGAGSGFRPAAYYAFSDGGIDGDSEATRKLAGDSSLLLRAPSATSANVRVAKEYADLTGPMTGLQLTIPVGTSDRFLTGAGLAGSPNLTEVISTDEGAAFVRFQLNGTPVYFSTSSEIVDIDQTIDKGFYDVKRHFCSVVPLVTFIKATFSEVAWLPQELGGCLIIDDPLLKPIYGNCDFLRLRDLMQKHRFTTNIAFIPWNWRRTSPKAAKLFSDGSGNFSVSIHGCDHTAREFGAVSVDVLDSAAELAQSRMRRHEARTGIHHDSVMVFPQGVFSASCPGILNRNDYLAAVNTELVPSDTQNAQTRIRDVWDVAIMSYGNFPIFTRRYAFHGVENFAFDLLLGKPCLIVAHHDFFKDGGAALIELVSKIESLNCNLHWSSLGNVIRGAYRQRTVGPGKQEIQMYGNELQVVNTSDHATETTIRKRIGRDDVVSEIRGGDKTISVMETGDGHVAFRDQIAARSEKRFRVIYQGRTRTGTADRSLRFKLEVSARRVISELRDNYLSRSSFRRAPANRLK